jgi:hypothetical protein
MTLGVISETTLSDCEVFEILGNAHFMKIGFYVGKVRASVFVVEDKLVKSQMCDEHFSFELFTTTRILEGIERKSLTREIETTEVDIEWGEGDLFSRIGDIGQTKNRYPSDEEHDNQDHDDKYLWSSDEV